MARADFYPQRPEHVLVRETHISWVFLAGDRAYKLKKPLVLAFLDYGTPQRRREMCGEEVRLNRRLAPDVYLGVRAVAATEAGFELAPEDDPRAVDYVVEMRRYDEERSMAALLRRGELRRANVHTAGHVLAQFHARAPQLKAVGVPALAVERRITENFHELLAIVDQRAEVERVLALERFAHAFVVAHAGMLNGRPLLGRIREGHGDLRAEHVLLDDGSQIVDCIEFDRRLREIDVADDLAFLVMDLVAHGGERFGRELVRAYREAGGEPGSDALIAFYAAYRALVRAKVALLRSAQHPARSAAHGHESARARDLLSLAERFAWQARLPLAIVVCGLPASGKSRFAEMLAASSGLANLSSDVTRKRIASIASRRPAGAGAGGADLGTLTYAELGRRAAREVAARGGVIVAATFRHRHDRDTFTATFADAAPLLFVECSAPPAVRAQRATLRDRAEATLAAAAAESDSWAPLDEVAPTAHLTIRSDRPVQAQLADVLGLLDQRLDRLTAHR